MTREEFWMQYMLVRARENANTFSDAVCADEALTLYDERFAKEKAALDKARFPENVG